MPTIITPVMAALSAASGIAGATIEITGSGFVDGNNIHGVFFGDVPAPDWHVEDDGHISGVIVPEVSPPGPGTVDVTVKTEGGIENFGGEPQVSNILAYEYTA